MKKLLLLGIFAGALAVAVPAQAGGFFSLNIGVPFVSLHIGSPPPPVRLHCAPVVVAPPVCAPRAVMIAPPRVIVRPPVVFAPLPVVVHRSHHYRVVAPPYCP